MNDLAENDNLRHTPGTQWCGDYGQRAENMAQPVNFISLFYPDKVYTQYMYHYATHSLP